MIKDYWIEEIKNIKEFQAISDVEDPEILNLNQELASLIDDQFIQTATEKGISRREKMLKIQPFADDTLSTRRFRVGVQWDNQLPYSYRQLERRLADLVGDDGYIITLTNGDYTLLVEINLGVKRMLADAADMVKNMAPSNLIVSVMLRYNRHIDLATVTHAHLATKTHLQIREEVL